MRRPGVPDALGVAGEAGIQRERIVAVPGAPGVLDLSASFAADLLSRCLPAPLPWTWCTQGSGVLLKFEPRSAASAMTTFLTAMHPDQLPLRARSNAGCRSTLQP